jgi:methyl-accepting chemotaxis protein
MIGYVVIGLRRPDKDLSDEKFADTCYYLGFIFTIVSIVFCLLDLPNIGTALEAIAVRFGAAMVSTVMGLIVRVYLVSFKKDFIDAVQASEDAILRASENFISQIERATETSAAFQVKLVEITQSTTDQVQRRLDENLKEHVEQVAKFLMQTSEATRLGLAHCVEMIETSASRFSSSTNQQLEHTQIFLQKLDTELSTFSSRLNKSLNLMELPHDFFSSRLQPALEELVDSTNQISQSSMQQIERTQIFLQRLDSELSTFLSSLARNLNLVELPHDFFSSRLNLPLEVLVDSTNQISQNSKTLSTELVASTEKLNKALNDVTEIIKLQDEIIKREEQVRLNAQKGWKMFRP